MTTYSAPLFQTVGEKEREREGERKSFSRTEKRPDYAQFVAE